MRTAHVILNPAAGRGAAKRALDEVARALHHESYRVEIILTERPEQATDLAAEAARQGAELIVAVGGDGTVHEVANGILRSGKDVTLGIVPIGSGNDFAKLVGVYRYPPRRAVTRLVRALPRYFDVGRVLGEYFVNSMGLGFDAAVVHTRNAMPNLRGHISYLVPIIKTFFTYRPQLLDVRAAEFHEQGYMMTVEICNGTHAGGDYRMAPDADPSDGWLDVCLIRRVSLPRFLMAVPKVMRGTHGRMREVALFKTRQITVRSLEQPLYLHLDGEFRAPPEREVTVDLESRRLKVLATT